MGIKHGIEGMDVRLYPDARYHLQWYKLDPVGPYTDYYALCYQGAHVADVFHGKYKLYGVVFGRCTLSGGDLKRMGMHIAGLFVNPQN